MAKNFRELEAKMTPEARERVTARVKETLELIEAMGGQLEIRAIFPDGSVRITQFSRDQ